MFKPPHGVSACDRPVRGLGVLPALAGGAETPLVAFLHDKILECHRCMHQAVGGSNHGQPRDGPDQGIPRRYTSSNHRELGKRTGELTSEDIFCIEYFSVIDL